jgi:quercetin dioxygenase-like cupin family protein
VEHSLTGWDIANAAEIHRTPWGSRGDATAKLIASADGFNVVVVTAEPGYTGDPHVHEFPEFLYVIAGSLRVQGHLVQQGDAYAAAAGSTHTEFQTDSGAVYLLIFKR